MLDVGTQLGPYEILGSLGAGGMGEVYRARDTRLNRDVALKVLPEAFVLDVDRLVRFKREAQVLASLNHPNIASIYGLEHTDAIEALVLELVEGPTLAERIADGPLPFEEALAVARQITEAVDAAHDQGIVHRDLKPANIKLRPDGTVKVLDFGLAKALDQDSGVAGDVSQSPTLTVAATGAGLILGTAAYMSPEQARGKPVDKRADIWAFGCILYEMLTGRPAFIGSDASEILASVIKSEPAWSALPAATPPPIQQLLRRCLQKDRRERLRDIGDARHSLADALNSPALDVTARSPTRSASPIRRGSIIVGTLALAGLLGASAVWLTSRPPMPRVSRLTITPPAAEAPAVALGDRGLAITANGSRIVYVGANRAALYVRPLDQLETTVLAGLGNPTSPFFSPDGEWIGFIDGITILKKVATTGGPALTVGRIDGGLRGAAWGTDGNIIFATPNRATGLQQIAAAGGASTVLTRPDATAGEGDHFWPQLLPDGQTVLFTITPASGAPDGSSVAIYDLRTGSHRVVFRGGSHAQYVKSGHLLFASTGRVHAVPFDLTTKAVVGSPVPVLSQVAITQSGATHAVVADDGTLVYSPGERIGEVERRLVWVDRQGREEPITVPPRQYQYPRISPDGARVALFIAGGEQDNSIWIWDIARMTLTRANFDPGIDTYPVWAPDNNRIFFGSSLDGPRNLFAQAADGTGTLERLTTSPNNQHPTAVSRDGARLVFTEIAPGTNDDVMSLWLTVAGRAGESAPGAARPAQDRGRESSREPEALIRTPFVERNGEISPDGRWLAYEANDSGALEIYVRPFPDVPKGRSQVSNGGGTRPLWAPSGEELYYLSPTGAVMRVTFRGGVTWNASAPATVFDGSYLADAQNPGRTFDVSRDGRRFLMIKPTARANAPPAPAGFVVVQNWFEELKQRVPE